MKEHFLLNVLVSPTEIRGIPTEWNREIRNPTQTLRIGEKGHAGPGNPAINGIGGIVGRNSIVEVQKRLVNRGATAVIPAPTYGYMRKDEFIHGH